MDTDDSKGREAEIRPQADGQAQAGERTKRWLEGIAGATGALLTLAVLAVLVYDGVTGGDGPPVLVIEAGDTHVVEGGHLVEIHVRNTGDGTAATLVVEGVVRERGQVVETREATFDYVSPRGSQSGGMVFSVDPLDGEHDLELRARSWVEP